MLTKREKRGLNHKLNWQILSYAFFPLNLISLLNAYSYQKSAKQNIAKGVSRTSAGSEMEFFVIIVYGFKSQTVFIENSVIDGVGYPGFASDSVRFINDLK